MLETPMPISGRELPRFTLRQEDVPGLGVWKVDSKHYLVLRVELVGKRNAKALGIDDSSDRGKVEGDFQIESIRVLGDKPVDARSLERADFEEVMAKVKSGKM